MPANMALYPSDWKSIRARILERDGHKCQFCGAANYEPHPITGSKVVLTIAHIHNPDPMDCRDENLAALCNLCHNRLDGSMRAKHAAETRRRKKIERIKASGQLELVFDEVVHL